MADALVHRGPDADGTYVDPDSGLVLAHRRLAVVDLSPAGAQPMHSPQGRYSIVFNGEIYNFGRLRSSLDHERPMHRWRGHSDTEVLLELIERRGLRVALDSVDGMFACALWDAHSRELTLFRDRFGEKPLYYGFVDGALVFASELRAFRALSAWDGRLDDEALRGFLRYGCVPGELAIFEGVRKLVPGTWLSFRARRGVPEAQGEPTVYWSLAESLHRNAQAVECDERQWVERLDIELRRAVTDRMVSDVPLGAFLSGGIDSSLVVAMMQAVSSRPVKTFCVGIGADGFNEAPHAAAIANHLGTDHTEVRLSEREALDTVPSIAGAWDEPFADASQLPTLLVSRVARTAVTVALSGDGGDEVFSGYSRYGVLERLALIPAGLRGALGALIGEVPARRIGRRFDRASKLGEILVSGDNAAMYERWMTVWPTGGRHFFAAECRKASERTFREQMMFSDSRRYLADDILVKVDRAAMSASLETRIPLLDRDLVALAWSMPVGMKYRDGQGKWILRRVLARYIPEPLFERPKAGFAIPLAAWLRGPLHEWAEALVRGFARDPVGGVDAEHVLRCWTEHVGGRRNWHYRLWAILMLQSWRDGIERRAS